MFRWCALFAAIRCTSMRHYLACTRHPAIELGPVQCKPYPTATLARPRWVNSFGATRVLQMSRHSWENQLRIFIEARERTNVTALSGWLGLLLSAIAIWKSKAASTVDIGGFSADGQTLYLGIAAVASAFLVTALARMAVHVIRGSQVTVRGHHLLTRPMDVVPTTSRHLSIM